MSTNLTLSGRRSDGNAKREKSSEHNLHIGAATGMSASDFAVCITGLGRNGGVFGLINLISYVVISPSILEM